MKNREVMMQQLKEMKLHGSGSSKEIDIPSEVIEDMVRRKEQRQRENNQKKDK